MPMIKTVARAIPPPNRKAIITDFCCNEKNFPAEGLAVAPGVHIADILIPLHDLSIGRARSIP